MFWEISQKLLLNCQKRQNSHQAGHFMKPEVPNVVCKYFSPMKILQHFRDGSWAVWFKQSVVSVKAEEHVCVTGAELDLTPNPVS